jgi:hypothetical protein
MDLDLDLDLDADHYIVSRFDTRRHGIGQEARVSQPRQAQNRYSGPIMSVLAQTPYSADTKILWALVPPVSIGFDNYTSQCAARAAMIGIHN